MTPPFHRHGSNETPAPHWVRRDETEGDQRYEIEPNHPKYVWESRQHEGVEHRKLAKRAPTSEAAAPTILPMSPTEYEGMDPARHFHQPKLHQNLNAPHKLFNGPPPI